MKRLLLAGTLVFLAALAIGLVASRALPGYPLVVSQPPSAQAESTPDGSLVTFEGIVRQASTTVPSTWIVGSQPFQFTANTELISNGLPVQPGRWARVEAVKLGQAAPEAIRVELQAVPTGEIYDKIVSIGPGSWQVGNTLVQLSEQTAVQGTPAVGALAFVHGRWSLDGLAATQAVVESLDDPAIYSGVIMQQEPDWWLVDDVVVEIEDDTSVVGDAELGALVEVYGAEVGPRRIRAQTVFVSTGNTEYQQRDGWLVSIQGQEYPLLWRVNLLEGTGITPVYVAVFEDTVVEAPAGPPSYQSWLDIQADDLGGGYLRARRIVVLPRPPKRTVNGIVDEMPANGPFGVWRVSGHRVEVTPDTAILGSPQQGSLVTAIGTPDYSNALRAESIEAVGE